MTLDEYRALRSNIYENNKERAKLGTAIRGILMHRQIDDLQQAVGCAYAALTEGEKPPEQADAALETLITQNVLEASGELRECCSADQLKASILWNIGMPRQSRQYAGRPAAALSQLAVMILSPGPGAKILSVDGGRLFMESALDAGSGILITQVTQDSYRAAAILSSSLLDFTRELLPEEIKEGSYDSVFAAAGVLSQAYRIGRVCAAHSLFDGADVAGVSAVWNHVAETVRGMRRGGTAVVVMPERPLRMERDAAVRQFFAERGLLCAAAALPPMLLEGTAIPCHMIVLGQNSTGKIRLVDARDVGRRTRHGWTWTNDEVRLIADNIRDGGDLTLCVSADQMKEKNWCWTQPPYRSSPGYRDTAVLCDLTKSIRRGSQLRSEMLDEYASNTVSSVRYVQMGDICDGILTPENATGDYLRELPEAAVRHVVPDHSIVLSKVTSGWFTSSVVENDTEMTLVADGNMYVIEPDETKIDPYYLQAYLASDEGNAALQTAASGASLLNLSQKGLQNIRIPLHAADVQRAIGQKYRKCSLECISLRKQAESMQSKLRRVWYGPDAEETKGN